MIDRGHKPSGLNPGDHVFYLYQTEDERWDVFINYIVDGLKRGERVYCNVDKETSEGLKARLIRQGIDFKKHLDDENLHFFTDKTMFMRKGVFDPFDVITFLHTETERAVAEGYNALRVAQEMEWGMKGIKDLGTMEGYDHQLNEFIANSKCALICIYNITKCDPAVLFHLMTMHPLVQVGDEIYTNFYYTPVPDKRDPKPAAAFLKYRLNNLKEHKRAEDALKLSEQRFRAMFENMSDGVAVYRAEEGGTDFIMVDFNRAAEKIEKVDRDKIIGRRVTDVFPGVKEMGILEVFRRVWESGKSEHLPLCIYKDERIAGWRDNFIYKLPSGEIVAIYSDATERKSAEEALRLERDRAKNYLDIVGVIILATTVSGKVTLINKKGCEALGYKEEEIVGKIWQDNFIPPQTREELTSTIRNVVLGKVQFPEARQNAILTKDGRERIISWHNTLLRNKDGGIIGILASGTDITEQKRADEALKESEARYRLFAENVSDVIWTTDLNLHYTFVSPSAEQLLGYTVEESTQKKLNEIMTPDSFAATIEVYKKELELENSGKGQPSKPVNIEMEFIRKDGSTVWTEARTSYLRDSAGQPVGILGVTRDISARKKAYKALRESESRYRLLAENVKDIIWVMNLNLEYTYMSPSVKTLRGFTVEEAMSQKLDEVVASESLAIAMETYGKELELEKQGTADPARTATMQMELKCRDGSTIWTEVKTSFVRDDEGRAVGFLGVTRDISERKKAEDAVRKSETLYRLLAENINDVIWMLGMNLRYTYVSPSIEKMLGYNSEEMIGKRAGGFFTPLSSVIVKEAMKGDSSREDEQSKDPAYLYTMELENVRKDGTTVWTESRMTLLFDDKGRQNGILGVTRDISARKQADDLKNRLVHADRLAMIGQLAAGVAHEINNPLAFILANISAVRDRLDELEDLKKLLMELLEKTGAPQQTPLRRMLTRMEQISGEFKEILEENQEGAERIRSVVKDLKSFARIERDEIEMVRINDIVNIACNMVYNEIRHRARLVKDLSDIPPISADRGKLSQVFMNLLVNAAHSIDVGAADRNFIKITTSQVEETVVITVEDSGCGIPQENISRIFEPFFTTKPRDMGTGLGLSLSAEIIRKHNGVISATSKLGVGSIFKIALPLETGLKPAQKPARTISQETPAHKARVLLIDDEETILAAYRRILSPPHEVVTAEGGANAISLLDKDSEFDVIFCDLMMPDVDGIAIYEMIREKRPHLEDRLVFCTGGAFTPRSKEFVASAKNLFLEKPIDIEILKSVVARMVGK